jgi:uncharacterized protein YeaO (DUF488 family)
MNKVEIKRIYEAVSDEDGYRILVDKLWPRGISKKKAALNEWNKKICPSTDIRKWFDHKEERFEEFTLKYKEELLQKAEDLDRIRKIANTEPITLLYAAKNEKINHAIILKNILNNKL